MEKKGRDEQQNKAILTSLPFFSSCRLFGRASLQLRRRQIILEGSEVMMGLADIGSHAAAGAPLCVPPKG